MRAIIDRKLQQCEAHPIVFSKVVKRSALIGLGQGEKNDKFKVQVVRNSPFEYIANLINFFVGSYGKRASFCYSDYDDSLSFVGMDRCKADICVLWLDYSRYDQNGGELINWLSDRIIRLITIMDCFVVVNTCHTGDKNSEKINTQLHKLSSENDMMLICNSEAVQSRLADRYWDNRIKEIGSLSLSSAAIMAYAQQIGLELFGCALQPKMKAVFVDLDHTLYDGVLGEDGIDGIKVDDYHLKTLKRLKALKESGVLLCIVSKNIQNDVDELFREHHVLKQYKDIFFAIKASWSKKSQIISDLLEELNIGEEACLFVDDNLGEISEVLGYFPAINVLFAHSSEVTCIGLKMYPGLSDQYSRDSSAGLRGKDLKKNKVRRSLRATFFDEVDYLNSMKIKIDYEEKPVVNLPRIIQISNKTNQFIFSYARFSEETIRPYFTEPNKTCFGFSLKDKLSNSGNIGAAFFSYTDGVLYIDEVCVSCRALGRGVEDYLLGELFVKVKNRFNAKQIFVELRRGERNEPAIQWVKKFSIENPGSEIGSVKLNEFKFSEILSGKYKIDTTWI